MSELWIPPTDKAPDPENIYDMMLIMQEILVGMESDEDRIRHAKFAVESLGANFDRMPKEKRHVALHTETAVYEKETDSLGLVYDIGIRGQIGSIAYLHLRNLQFGLSLKVDTCETFTPNNPDDNEPTRLALAAPITAVRYIETD
jgi:hypothetical protein